LVWGSLHGDDSKEQAFTYSIRICEFKSRLDLLGFTLEKTKSDFEESKLGEIERMTDANDRLRERLYDSDLAILERANFEDFLVAFQTIRERRLMGCSTDSIVQHDDL
jgi:uncharacterized protein YigA (DUF484 family)